MGKEIKTVFVGVSGGVDSSVSARLLKDQGYNVVGVFIRTWTPDFIECTWRSERRDAMRACAHLGIPFLECDAEEAYKNGVADYMIEEYKNGRTPNPDVMCNREVKFGVFWDYALAHGADFIATGHYAKNNYELRIKNYELGKSPDSSKDQSYFLWTLTQSDLSHVLFPIGHLYKRDVRKLAKKYKLPNAVKKDSQGVCFLGPLDMKDFLKHYIKSEKGDVLLARQSLDDGGNDDGEVIGYHDGAVFFTIGERHGFNITKKSEREKPLYVVEKDIKNNTITVSYARQGLAQKEKKAFNNGLKDTTRQGLNQGKNIVNIINTNWISVLPEKDKKPASPTSQGGYIAQIRYHGELLSCSVEILEENNAQITFDESILVDSGQSIVIYDGDICLGGGIVK